MQKSRARRFPLWIPIVMVAIAIIFAIAIAGAYQNLQREAHSNAQTLAYEINLTVVATLTP